jgi:hypothetical protein
LQAIEGDFISHGFSCELKYHLFDHSIIWSHTHHLWCMHSFKCGHGNETPLTNWKITTFGSFCHKVMHLFDVLGEQSLCNICNATHVDFAHPFQL